MTDLPEPQQAPALTRDELAAMYPAPEPIQAHERDALERLIALAKGDTGHRAGASRRSCWRGGTPGRTAVSTSPTCGGLIARSPPTRRPCSA